MTRTTDRATSVVVHILDLGLDPGPALGALTWALDGHDRARLDSLRRHDDRMRLATSRALLRLALADATGIAPEQQRFVRRCVVCGGAHGRPRLLPPGADPDDPAPLRSPHASISHAGTLVLVGLATDPLGVDVEAVEGAQFSGFDDIALTAGERAELAALAEPDRARARVVWWTRKEAVLKATGHGLVIEPSALRVAPPHEIPELREWTAPGVDRPRVAMTDLALPAPYAGAVAVIGASRVEAVVRRVSAGELVRNRPSAWATARDGRRGSRDGGP